MSTFLGALVVVVWVTAMRHGGDYEYRCLGGIGAAVGCALSFGFYVVGW
jgi:hypothetical protein